MSIDIDRFLVETATKYVTTINEFNDIQYGAQSSSACLYRDMTTLIQGQNREEVTIDGILWFAAAENVARGDIYYHPSEGFLRIEKVIKAKRLVGDNSHQFTKTMVSKQRQVS